LNDLNIKKITKRSSGCGINEISIISRATENSIFISKTRQIVKVSSF